MPSSGNSLQIKDLLLLKTVMEFVCIMAKAFRLMRSEPHIFSNSLKIKDFLLV
jgi:hypothetical protein